MKYIINLVFFFKYYNFKIYKKVKIQKYLEYNKYKKASKPIKYKLEVNFLFFNFFSYIINNI